MKMLSYAVNRAIMGDDSTKHETTESEFDRILADYNQAEINRSTNKTI